MPEDDILLDQNRTVLDTYFSFVRSEYQFAGLVFGSRGYDLVIYIHTPMHVWCDFGLESRIYFSEEDFHLDESKAIH